MGTYFSPGNRGFQTMRNGVYVDKTGLLKLINDTIGTAQKLTCISRPRRFGKSFAAKMLCAYYDKSCDSSALFADLEIAEEESYRKHLNQYNVIYLDMTNIMGKTEPEKMLSFIEENVTEELLRAYPAIRSGKAFDDTLADAVELSGSQFIVIIDEWDAPIREMPKMQREYLHFLRTLFKSSGPEDKKMCMEQSDTRCRIAKENDAGVDFCFAERICMQKSIVAENEVSSNDKIFAAAYMTGILPIKKDGSQSAISDFKEYTMIKPRKFAEYIGFTEEEVKILCEEHGADFAKMKHWYDGYSFPYAESVYNPNSVMEAMRNGDYESYWTQTSAADSLMEYISLDYDGLSKTITELIAGIDVEVDTLGFLNDLVSFHNRDDVLTMLIHLGYLAYDAETETVRIPNEEIRQEFARTIRSVKRADTIQRVRESDQLIYDTVHGNADAVAAQIEKIHEEETVALFYNNEQALRSVIKLAYFSYKDHYVKFEELPAGAGYADIVYLPKKRTTLPALVIEMKWEKSAEGAIAQIKNKHYPDAIKEFDGDILLVGINYDKNAPAGERKHTCVIEEYERG